MPMQVRTLGMLFRIKVHVLMNIIMGLSLKFDSSQPTLLINTQYTISGPLLARTSSEVDPEYTTQLVAFF